MSEKVAGGGGSCGVNKDGGERPRNVLFQGGQNNATTLHVKHKRQWWGFVFLPSCILLLTLLLLLFVVSRISCFSH